MILTKTRIPHNPKGLKFKCGNGTHKVNSVYRDWGTAVSNGTGRYPTIIWHLPNLRKHLKNNLIIK